MCYRLRIEWDVQPEGFKPGREAIIDTEYLDYSESEMTEMLAWLQLAETRGLPYSLTQYEI